MLPWVPAWRPRVGEAQCSPGSPPGGLGWGKHRAPLGPRLEAWGGGSTELPWVPAWWPRGKHSAHRPYVRLSCLPGCIWLPQERTASNQGAGTISAFLAFQSFVWEFYGIL